MKGPLYITNECSGCSRSSPGAAFSRYASDQALLQRLVADGPAPRLLIVTAHPDDEVIGAGAQLPRWRGAGFLQVTDGSPSNPGDALAAGFKSREAYGAARRRELRAALALAGVSPQQLCRVNFIDQETSFHLLELAEFMADALREIRPEVVLTHPYEGGHPDHDATAFAVHTGCRLLDRRQGNTPAIVEMTSYHNSAGKMATSEFLSHPDCPEETIALAPEQSAFKKQLFECFASQKHVLAGFPIAVEKFRLAPAYDFGQPPHTGILYYEMFPWGIDGPRWRAMARQALSELGLTATPQQRQTAKAA